MPKILLPLLTLFIACLFIIGCASKGQVKELEAEIQAIKAESASLVNQKFETLTTELAAVKNELGTAIAQLENQIKQMDVLSQLARQITLGLTNMETLRQELQADLQTFANAQEEIAKIEIQLQQSQEASAARMESLQKLQGILMTIRQQLLDYSADTGVSLEIEIPEEMPSTPAESNENTTNENTIDKENDEDAAPASENSSSAN